MWNPIIDALPLAEYFSTEEISSAEQMIKLEMSNNFESSYFSGDHQHQQEALREPIIQSKSTSIYRDLELEYIRLENNQIAQKVLLPAWIQYKSQVVALRQRIQEDKERLEHHVQQLTEERKASQSRSVQELNHLIRDFKEYREHNRQVELVIAKEEMEIQSMLLYGREVSEELRSALQATLLVGE